MTIALAEQWGAVEGSSQRCGDGCVLDGGGIRRGNWGVSDGGMSQGGSITMGQWSGNWGGKWGSMSKRSDWDSERGSVTCEHPD